MPTVSNADLQAALNAYSTSESFVEAAKRLKIPVSTVKFRVRTAQEQGLKASEKVLSPAEQIRRLERELKVAQEESADAAAIKRLFGDAISRSSELVLPRWMAEDRSPAASPGVPTLFLSDFHWGEQVRPGQINGVNRFNLKIAHERLERCITKTIRLLGMIDKPVYPGIVIPLGGDMISGDIHDELKESNEIPTIPTVLDLHAALARLIEQAAERFGNVFLPCVTGNHGRNTKKIRAKDRHHTSFDWMLYQLLARSFSADKRVRFYIPDSADAVYRVFNTTFNLTHGDQFRGGDGLIGPLGPITRGDHKKRSRAGQISQPYDVMMHGHFHTYSHSERVIGNGSLKGYDEYAFANNFGFEVPQQALFITHAKYGITFRLPVKLEVEAPRGRQSWVSVPQVA